jgi:hypothetical protein
MYEPHYAQPGYYAPRPASTYYGGEVWPPMYSGTERPTGVYQPGKRRDVVEVVGGESRMVGEVPPPPGNTSRGQIFASMAGLDDVARPAPSVTLGPTSSELGYRYQQGDPGVTTTRDGDLVERTALAPPVMDRLAGLFGSQGRKSSQPMPLPPGSRRSRDWRMPGNR